MQPWQLFCAGVVAMILGVLIYFRMRGMRK